MSNDSSSVVKTLNVLLFPAGTEIGLEIFHSLKSTRNIRLFAAGQDISNHARSLFQDYHVLPSVREAGWQDELTKLCRSLCLDYIFPCHDEALVAMAELPSLFPAKIVTSTTDTCLITRSKRSTYQRLRDTVAVPEIYASAHDLPGFPILVKPDKGQGSFGVTIVHKRQQLQAALDLAPDPLMCEYLPGKEFTVDCVSDSSGQVVYAQARRRGRMRNGIAVNTSSCNWPEARHWASAIAGKIAMKGAWFFQIKETALGQPVLLEVAPRIAGSMALHRVRGVNFPLLSILAHEGVAFTVHDNMVDMEMDRALYNRYIHQISFSAAYVDLDDTLIVHGKINEEAIRFVYQCISDRKPVHLITRHAGNLAETLSKWRLQSTFDSVIHITDGSPKSRHMIPNDAILIDDSFSERADALHHGFKSFDPGMLECLTKNQRYHT